MSNFLLMSYENLEGKCHSSTIFALKLKTKNL